MPSKWVQPTRPDAQLKAEVGSLVWLSKGALMAVFSLVALGASLGFLAAVPLVGHPPPDAAFVLRPARVMFALPCMVLGAATAGLLERYLDRWIAKDRYWDMWYVDYRNRRPRAPPPGARNYLAERRTMTFLVPALATVSLAACCLVLDMYAYVTPTRMSLRISTVISEPAIDISGSV